jgi:hypothetical protein
MRPNLKKTLHRQRAGEVVQGVGPEFKPQYCREKERNQNPILNTDFEILK